VQQFVSHLIFFESNWIWIWSNLNWIQWNLNSIQCIWIQFIIFEFNFEFWIQFKLHVMSFNISIQINLIFTKSSFFFHHFFSLIACSKHIAPSSPLQNIHSVSTRNLHFGMTKSFKLSPLHGMDTRKIFPYTPCKDTTFYPRCFLGMAHSHVWPTFAASILIILFFEMLKFSEFFWKNKILWRKYWIFRNILFVELKFSNVNELFDKHVLKLAR
jgi:hypothetical protein